MEGDVSRNGSEDEDDAEPPESSGWASGGWGLKESEKDRTTDHGWNAVESHRIPYSSGSSTTGWDGDESDDTT
jgi:hypothetical protein